MTVRGAVSTTRSQRGGRAGSFPCPARFARFPARRRVYAACLLLLLPLLAGCHSEDLLGQGILVVGLESNPTSLDPRIATDAASSRIGDLVFNALFRKDADGQPVHDLVETWEQTDPCTYRFRLRQGVRFHDGRPLEAKDVQYTFESLLDPALGSPLRGSYRLISEIQSPDSRTVVFQLREPFSPFLVSLDLGIVPRPREGGEKTDGPGALVGSGPFRLVSWDSGSEVRLEAYPDYHEGPPGLREVRFKIVPDNTVRILELRKGTVHLIQNEVEPELLPALRENPRLKVQERPGTHYSYLGFNLRDPFLKSLRVRKAMAHAVDREAIVRHLLGGLAVPATGVLSPLNWAYEPEVTAYPYDPDRARKLLDEAGYPDPDGPGPGKRFALSYKTSQNDLRRRIGEALQSQFEAVGIGMDIRSFEWGTFYADIMKGNFQTYTLTWVGVADPDIYHYLFHSGSMPPEGANRGYYENPEMDRLLELGRMKQDRRERKRIYGEVQRILAAELPYLSLWYAVNVVVMDRRIQGFVLQADGNLRSLKVARVAAGNPG